MRGVLSVVAGRSPAAASSNSSSSTPGTTARASQSSWWTAPACTEVSSPRSSTVAPTTTEPSRRGTRYTERPRTRPRTVRVSRAAAPVAAAARRAEAQDVPLDRTDGREPGGLEAGDGGQARSRRQDDDAGPEAAAVGQLELGARGDGGHGAVDERDAGGAAGPDERVEQGAVVDLVVPGDLDAAAQRGAQCGHQGATLARALALGGQPERVLVGEEVIQAGAVGRIERDRDRAGRVVTDGAPGDALQGGGERGPAAGALEQEGGEGGLAELGLGDRGEHAGRHPRGAVAPGCGCHDRHLVTVACQFPRTGEPDDTAPHDLDVRRHEASLGGCSCILVAPPSGQRRPGSRSTSPPSEGRRWPLASTTRHTSTTPAVSAWWPICTAVPITRSWTAVSPSSSVWPTAARLAPRWRPATAPASWSRSRTASCRAPPFAPGSPCPMRAATPWASPSCPPTPTTR